MNDDALPWFAWRHGMPVTSQWAYLDHAAVAPLPQVTARAMQEWSERQARHGDTDWARERQQVEVLRALCAQLLRVTAEEIAFTANTTTGIGWIAEGFRWSPGDNLVVLGNEFPSNRLPWLHLASRGVTPRIVEVHDGRVEREQIQSACDAHTRLVALSWVGYASGWRADLGEIAEWAQRRGIRVVVDAIQGLGVFPLDLQQIPIDFLIADGHKWLLGPEGAGLVFIRRERLAELRPVGVGWQSVVDPWAFEESVPTWRDDAAIFEGGSHNLVGLQGLLASLQWLVAHGLDAHDDAIAARVIELADYAADQITARGGTLLYPRDTSHRSGIVTFSWRSHNPKAVRRRCHEAGVAVSARGGGIRISPHAYNNAADIDRLIDALP